MPKYENGLIYKLIHNDDHENTNIYIGSTTNFRGRKNKHKSNCYNENSKDYNCKVYQFIRDNGGWNEWVMIQLESFPCNNKQELKSRERYYIELMKSKLNQQIPTRTKKEYANDNKEKKKENEKKYNENNKEKIAVKSKKYRDVNKEKIAEKYKEYYQCNKEQKKEKVKEYYNDNKEIINEKKKEYSKQIVVCNICNCEITKGCLKNHQKTAKCQKKAQEIK